MKSLADYEYYRTELGVLYCGDCLSILPLIPDNSVDLVLTSPPYDNLREYNDYSFDFNKIAPHIYYKIAKGGVLVWIVGDATVDGSETGTSFYQALCFKNLSLNLHDTMIFKKINPIPLTHNRYEQHFEYMFVFSYGKPKTFNPILENCITSGSYTHRRNTGRVKESATRNRDEETLTKETKYKGNIWEYVIGSAKGETGNHPAPFPELLAQDHIKTWSNINDLVLDPFFGSGTTGIACEKLNRRWIGIEISEKYCEIAKKRISVEANQLKLFK